MLLGIKLSFFQVSEGNTTVVEPYTKRALYQMEHDFGLFQAMRGAGSSYGIVTEFMYKIYPEPETLPIVAMIYIKTPYDLRKLEKAALDGRYHVSWFNVYSFSNIPLAADVLVSEIIEPLHSRKFCHLTAHGNFVAKNHKPLSETSNHFLMHFLIFFPEYLYWCQSLASPVTKDFHDGR